MTFPGQVLHGKRVVGGYSPPGEKGGREGPMHAGRIYGEIPLSFARRLFRGPGERFL